MEAVVYAATGHPQDPEKRRPTLNVLRLAPDGSELRLAQTVELPEGAAMPMFQCVPPDSNTLYTVAGPLGVLAYKIDPSHGTILPPSAYSETVEPVGSYQTDEPALSTAIEGQPQDSVPGGAGACHICLDAQADVLLCANYESGSVATLPVVDSRTGDLGPPASSRHGAGAEAGVAGSRQAAAHPHGIFVDPTNHWVLSCDLGTNAVHCYELGAGRLRSAGAIQLHAGAGPRHLTFHPSGALCFTINELDNTVTSLRLDASSGALSEVGHWSTLPEGWLATDPPRPFDFYAVPSHASAIVISPDGRHLYATNRGHDSIAVFAVQDGGALAFAGAVPSGGRLPWVLDWAGEFLLAQNQYAADREVVDGGGGGVGRLPADPGNITVFRRAEDGSLSPTGAVWMAPQLMTVCVARNMDLGPRSPMGGAIASASPAAFNLD